MSTPRLTGVSALSVEDALHILHELGEVFEVRIFHAPGAGTVSGYFDDAAKAAQAIAAWDGKVPGVYVTLNPIDPELLQRAHNILKERVADAAKDSDVLRRRWLLIDVDFQREAKTSATNDEVQAAGGVTRRIKAHLEDDLGWPAGVLTMSGNGAHLLYRIDLPNDDDSKALVKRVLAKLDEQFGEHDPDGAQVDQTVGNASRVVKVPGTKVCKGVATKERPHRRSRIVELPAELSVVPAGTLLAFAPVPMPKAPLVPPAALQSGGNGHVAFDVEEWMARYGLAVRIHKPGSGGGDLWELKVCPFNPEHDQGEAFITRNAAGALLAGCHHNSCRWWRWHDLRSRFEPEYRQKQIEWQRQREAALAKDAARDQTETPEVCTDERVFIDWSAFWDRDYNEAEWVYPDVLARGRGHAIYAAHKLGKSLLMLYIAAKLATGSEPVAVIYLDYEMTEADIFDRLEDMGYGPGSDLSRLLYDLLPTLPPLDTGAGAQALTDLVDRAQKRWPEHHMVVIIDTISRAVCGEENSADTFRNFYNHTGIQLKRRGITWARLDHSGKDKNQGQRGSSSKGDDVDVVWKLTRTANGVCLHRELARMSWVLPNVTFGIFEEPLRYVRLADDWPDGTGEVANMLDRLGVPQDASTRTAQDALKTIGEGRRRQVVLAAIRWRNERLGEAS